MKNALDAYAASVEAAHRISLLDVLGVAVTLYLTLCVYAAVAR